MKELSMEVDNEEVAAQPEITDKSKEDTDKPKEDTDKPKEDTENVHGAEQYMYHYPDLFTGKPLLELCNSSWSRSNKNNTDVQPYLRACKWSPDGTCCLTVVNSDGMHLNELPADLYTGTPSPGRTIDILDTALHIKESGLIYDCCWYPGMNSAIRESCCWITTRQNGPIQMWDAIDGSLRCSYRGFNAVDEMEPAISVAFSAEGSRIIAGYRKALRTFDVERPGRDFVTHKIASAASCIATTHNMIAVGSWNTTINLYNINDMGGYKSMGKMHGHAGGVTHMKFTPDGLHLVSGARKDHRLLVWDIRYYRRPLNVLHRAVDTNQRVYFDVSPCGKYLVSGGTDGILKVWDVSKCNWKRELCATEDGSDNATYKFPLHNDSCNSVAIHPIRPMLATGSGQYHIKDPITALDQDMELNEDNNDVNLKDTSDVLLNAKDMKYSSEYENSLVFWWIGDILEST